MKTKLWMPMLALPLLFASCEDKKKDDLDKAAKETKAKLDVATEKTKDAMDAVQKSDDKKTPEAKAKADVKLDEAAKATEEAKAKEAENDKKLKDAAGAVPVEPAPTPPPAASGN